MHKINQKVIKMRKYLILLLLTCTFFLVKPVEKVQAQTQQCGGPLVLMGIDAEDRSVGEHGPITTYAQIVRTIHDNSTNGGTGILVIGAGKTATDDVTTFWNQISTLTGIPVTFVNGAANITARSFTGFRMIVVASAIANTPSGGLTPEEHSALVTRSSAITNFINGGGGLLAFTANGFPNPYGYLSEFGTFTVNTGVQYQNITPTAAGLAIGITDALDQDFEFWHDEYLTFPFFFQVLATNQGLSPGNTTPVTRPGTIGAAAAIGGLRICSIPTAATAKVSGRIRDVNGKSASRVTVTLTNLSNGESFTTRTNFFGRYTFEDVPTGASYSLKVSSKRYVFSVNEMVINLLEDLTDANFTATSTGSLN